MPFLDILFQIPKSRIGKIRPSLLWILPFQRKRLSGQRIVIDSIPSQIDAFFNISMFMIKRNNLSIGIGNDIAVRPIREKLKNKIIPRIDVGDVTPICFDLKRNDSFSLVFDNIKDSSTIKFL